MDFLDPKKQRQHTILLMSGYVLIGIAIAISTLVLIWQSHGFGVNAKGQVVQSGFVFVSSQPSGAQIYLNNQLQSNNTNTRLSVPSGAYTLTLKRTGYRDWTHPIGVLGGDVQYYDYPFLFPTKLDTTATIALPSAAGLATQSPDKRWLLVQQAGTDQFDLYDLKNPTNIPSPTVLTIPAADLAEDDSSHSWSAVQWADDNQHVLLAHAVSTGTEYVELDRTDATKTVNLNKALSLTNPTQLQLLNTKYDQFTYVDADGTLNTATLNNPQPQPLATGVLAYKTYGANEVVYATSVTAPAGKVLIQLRNGDTTYPIRQLTANTTYLLDIASYSGTPYVVAGSSADNAVYIYKDPIGQLRGDSQLKAPSALSVLRVGSASYESFSPTAQYVLVESGSSFGVQDLELHRFRYYNNTSQPLDAPQVHVAWMDGSRLAYVSGGKLTVFDFDDRNKQTLMAASPDTGAFFAPDYKYVYALGTNTDDTPALLQTSLLTAADR